MYSARLAVLKAMKLHRPSNVHHLCTIVGPLCGLLLARLWLWFPVETHTPQPVWWGAMLSDTFQFLRHQAAEEVPTGWFLGASRHQLMHVQEQHKEPNLPPHNKPSSQWRTEHNYISWEHTRNIWKSGKNEMQDHIMRVFNNCLFKICFSS